MASSSSSTNNNEPRNNGHRTTRSRSGSTTQQQTTISNTTQQVVQQQSTTTSVNVPVEVSNNHNLLCCGGGAADCIHAQSSQQCNNESTTNNEQQLEVYYCGGGGCYELVFTTEYQQCDNCDKEFCEECYAKVKNQCHRCEDKLCETCFCEAEREGCPFCPDNNMELVPVVDAADDEQSTESSSSPESQLKGITLTNNYANVDLRRYKGTVYGFRARAGGRQGYDITIAVLPIEAAVLCTTNSYLCNQQPSNTITTDIIVAAYREQTEMVREYVDSERHRCGDTVGTKGSVLCRRELTWIDMISRIEVVLGRLETMKKFKKARSTDWKKRLKEVKSYFGLLKSLSLADLPATLPLTPWNNQETSTALSIINDCLKKKHTKGGRDINILKDISVLGHFFSGTSMLGHPVIHEGIFVEGGAYSKQKLLQMKMTELNVLVVLLYKWLADHHRKLFELYIPAEWRKKPGSHPKLTSNNLLSVIDIMKESVLDFSSINGVHSPHYTPIFLHKRSEVTSIVEDGCNVTADQWGWNKNEVLEKIDLPQLKQQFFALINSVSILLFVCLCCVIYIDVIM